MIYLRLFGIPETPRTRCRSNPARRNAKPEPAHKAAQRAADHSLTDRAYTKLEELIVTVQLEPGDIVSEAALSRQLRIGRTPHSAKRCTGSRGNALVNICRGAASPYPNINVGAQLRLLEVRRRIERLSRVRRHGAPARRAHAAQIWASLRSCGRPTMLRLHAHRPRIQRAVPGGGSQ